MGKEKKNRYATPQLYRDKWPALSLTENMDELGMKSPEVLYFVDAMQMLS